MQYHNDTELSSLEETRSEFNRSKADMFAEGRIRPVCGLGSMCTRIFMWWWSKWVGDAHTFAQQPTDPPGAGGKDPRPHGATAKRRWTQSTAWTWADDQRGD